MRCQKGRVYVKSVVIIPTYNERQSIKLLLRFIMDQQLPDLDVLVVDDSSPDGTSQQVIDMINHCPAVHLLLQPRKLGLRAAYAAGFQWAISEGYKAAIQMDADLSHDPRELPQMLKQLELYDFVIGSRYIAGGRIENWSAIRMILSTLANLYARALLTRAITDFTGGYNAWNIRVLQAIELDSMTSEGYCFQIEAKYRAIKKDFSFAEFPIVFRERIGGKSKISKRIILEAIVHVPRLRNPERVAQ